MHRWADTGRRAPTLCCQREGSGQTLPHLPRAPTPGARIPRLWSQGFAHDTGTPEVSENPAETRAQAASPPSCPREWRAPTGGQSWEFSQGSLAGTARVIYPSPKALGLSHPALSLGSFGPVCLSGLNLGSPRASGPVPSFPGGGTRQNLCLPGSSCSLHAPTPLQGDRDPAFPSGISPHLGGDLQQCGGMFPHFHSM